MPLESSRQIALQIVRDLTNAGHRAYWVGGCVRDQLLGLTPKDYDVATDAHPDTVLRLFEGSSLVGASFGVVLAPGGVEVATFRSEGQYRDGRRPDVVRYETDPARDAARRDFTMNAIYYDPLADRVLDFTGGRQDLESGVVRAIGEPRERFSEDHLRLLRAVRFAARFRYTIDATTFEAMRELAPLIRRVAGERLHDEMRRILTGPNLDCAWRYLKESSLFAEMVPEAMAGDRITRLEGAVSVALGWAALLEGVTDPRDIYHRFRFSSEEAEQCSDLLECESRFDRIETMTVAEQKRFARKANFNEHLQLRRATRGELNWTQQWSHAELWPAPLLNGQDLIAMGLEPGPQFKEILTRIENAQLEGRALSRADAERLALA